jgi:predicted Rossmann fold flavoprotein
MRGSVSAPTPYDVAVIGAGAAGMMCAATAGARGRRVLLVDHYKELGEKIRISGGGRCNFTNLHATWRDYLSRNPDFCRSALARYTPAHFIALVERHGIAYHEKTLGQLFCDGRSTQVIDMLKAECDAAHVEWRRPCGVGTVEKGGDGFRVATDAGMVNARALVVATGGLTVPKIGATPFAYRLAEQFGMEVVPPKPALVPLALAPEALTRYGELAGVSMDVVASCGRGRFREAMLFTHRGLSGPAVLQASSYWQFEEARLPLSIDLLVDEAWLQAQRRSPATLATVLSEKLPRRFAQLWTEERGIDRPMAQLSDAVLREVAQALADWRVVPTGTLGYNKAEVTLGGIDTRGLSSKTMESTAVAGLYFIGEAVDVTGHLGGFNFQWAWASGHAAGLAC